MADRVLAAKAAARVHDHSLYLLAYCTEPPHLATVRPKDRRLDHEFSFGTDGEVSSICKHRLQLLDKFTYLTDAQNLKGGVPRLLRPPWERPSEPAYQEFLANVEKLPNEGMREAVRRVRAEIARGPNWRPGFPKVAPPPAKLVPNAEVVLHPVKLTVVETDGKEYPFAGSHGAGLISWIKTADGINAVLGRRTLYLGKEKGRSTYWPLEILYLMKERGRLIRLPLEILRTTIEYVGSTPGMNICWDGRFLWVVSPGTPEEASVATATRKRFLAVIDPQSEQIVKLTADDGLPPMSHVDGGSAAVTALGPGRVLVAGSFGRSWCGIATFSRVNRIALDLFFEAREVFEHNTRESAAKTAAFPIAFLCTLNPPAAAGRTSGQRVLLGRVSCQTRPPLLIDPEKRSVEVVSENMITFARTTLPYSVHDGSLYWRYWPNSQNLTQLGRIGFPDFRPEQVNTSAPLAHF